MIWAPHVLFPIIAVFGAFAVSRSGGISSQVLNRPSAVLWGVGFAVILGALGIQVAAVRRRGKSKALARGLAYLATATLLFFLGKLAGPGALNTALSITGIAACVGGFIAMGRAPRSPRD